jgi:tetratricopeptide (TPR) repeat protein
MSHIYISYDQIDGFSSAKVLHDKLETGLPKFSTWLLDIHLTEKEDTFSEVTEAMQTCKSVIIILTNNSTSKNSRCKEELKKAIEYKKPIVAIQYSPSTNLPPRLLNRKSFRFYEVDKTDELKQYLNQIDSFEQKLITFNEYLQDAKNDLLYCNDETKHRIENEIKLLNEQIDSLQQYLSNKEGTARRTEERILLSIERERRPEKTSLFTPAYKVINNPPTIAPSYFQDRIIETDLVVKFLQSESVKFITVVGRGGVGKTAMVCRLLKSLEKGLLPDNSTGIDFSGIIYMNEVGSRPINFPNIFSDLSILVEESKRRHLMQLQENTQSTVSSKLSTLLGFLPPKPIIVLLDNFEDKLDPELRNIKDTELRDALLHLLKTANHPIKVVITTRVPPTDFDFIEPGRQRSIDLNEGLESPYAENVLRELDADGHLGLKNADPELLKKISEKTRGFPRALEAFYAILSADRSTSIQDLLNTKIPTETLTQTLVGEAYNRLSEIDQKIMQGLSIYGFPVLPSGIDYLLKYYIPNIDSLSSLKRLVNMHFVRMEGREFYLHPLDREYALSRISDKSMADENLNFFKKELFAIAAEYMHQIGLPRNEWKTLNDITPQIREFYLLVESDDSYYAKYTLQDLSDFFDRKGGFSLKLKMAEKLEQIAFDYSTKKVALELQANSYWRKGDLDEAVRFQKKLIEYSTQETDEFEKLRITANLFIIESDLKSPQENLESFLFFLEELKTKYPWNKQNIAVTHLNIATNYKALGYYEKAIEHAKESLEIRELYGNLDEIEGATHNYGDAIEEIDRNEAIAYYKRALEMAEKSGNPLWKANHLSSLASCYFDNGKIDYAIQKIKEAIQIRKEIGDLGGEAGNNRNLAKYLLHKGKIDEAKTICNQVLEQAKDLGLNLSSYYTTSSEILLEEGKIEEAFETVNKALEYSRSASYSLYNLAGVICFLLDKISPSKDYFQKALSEAETYISRSAKNASAIAAKALALAGLAKLGTKNDEYKEKAIKAYRQARELDNGKVVIQTRYKLFKSLRIEKDSKIFYEAITGELAPESTIDYSNVLSPSPDNRSMSTLLKAFVSYSKFDGESNTDGINYLEEFKQSLAPLSSKFNNLLETWDDTFLVAGDEWDDEIKNQLKSCDVIFLLISRHFLNTRYIIDVELANAIERHKRKECIIVPIVLKACGWADIPILKIFNGIPRKGHRVSAWEKNPDWTSREDAWQHVYEEVKKLVKEFKSKRTR